MVEYNPGILNDSLVYQQVNFMRISSDNFVEQADNSDSLLQHGNIYNIDFNYNIQEAE